MRQTMRAGMTALTFCACFFACAALALPAQQQTAQQPKGTDPAKEANDRFEYMSKQLGLTDQQKPKVKAIVDAQMQDWLVLEKNKTLNGKQKIARMQEINQSTEAKIDKLLTAEQKKKLQAIMEASKAQPAHPSPQPKKQPQSGE